MCISASSHWSSITRVIMNGVGRERGLWPLWRIILNSRRVHSTWVHWSPRRNYQIPVRVILALITVFIRCEQREYSVLQATGVVTVVDFVRPQFIKCLRPSAFTSFPHLTVNVCFIKCMQIFRLRTWQYKVITAVMRLQKITVSCNLIFLHEKFKFLCEIFKYKCPNLVCITVCNHSCEWTPSTWVHTALMYIPCPVV